VIAGVGVESTALFALRDDRLAPTGELPVRRAKFERQGADLAALLAVPVS
jgi:hypothetical protein